MLWVKSLSRTYISKRQPIHSLYALLYEAISV